MWNSTNLDDNQYLIYCGIQLVSTLDQFNTSWRGLHILDWGDFKSMKPGNAIRILSLIINKTVEELIDKNKNHLAEPINVKTNSNILSKQDCYKLYVCSNLHYPFWEFSYEGLYIFYIECYNNTQNYNIDLFIGKLRYLFDNISEEDLKKLEKFVNTI